MEDMFNKLKTAGKNTSENLVKWLKDSNVIGKTKDEEDNTRKMFDSVKNKGNVEFSEFKDILSKISGNQKTTLEELTKKVTDSGPDVLKALQGAASTASTAVSAGASKVANAIKGFGKK